MDESFSLVSGCVCENLFTIFLWKFTDYFCIMAICVNKLDELLARVLFVQISIEFWAGG